jgi:hypothetical protein
MPRLVADESVGDAVSPALGAHAEKPDWQVRVIEERAQLYERRERLRAFIGGVEYAKMHEIDRELLLEQRRIMSELIDVLDQRIARFA